MSVEITEPTDGKVILELDWAEAEVLIRVVGLTQGASLFRHAPVLYETVTTLIEHFGRSNGEEEENYRAEIRGGMVFIEPVE